MEFDALVDKARALHNAGVKGKLGIKGTLNFRDKDGNIVQTMELNGSVPISQLAEHVDDSHNR